MRLNRKGQPFGENQYLTRRRNREALPATPQRYRWKTVATYGLYDDALADKEQRECGDKPVKIKLRGERFAVRVGIAIPRSKSEPAEEPTE